MRRRARILIAALIALAPVAAVAGGFGDAPNKTAVTTSGVQTLTNKSIAASEVNSGTLSNARLSSSITGVYNTVTFASNYDSRIGAFTALVSGNDTGGITFQLSAAAHIQGATFWWQGGKGALTVKTCLYKNASQQECVNTSVNLKGIYTVTWASGAGGSGSYAVAGADLYARWTITMYESSGLWLSETPYTQWSASGPLPPYSQSNGASYWTGGYVVEHYDWTHSGDAIGNASAAGYYDLVEPVFTFD
jgi:hypothetical protein